MHIQPDIKVFLKNYKSIKYKRFCLWTEISADLDTPITAYMKLINNSKNTFLLESVEGGTRRGRFSIIGLETDKVIKCNKLDKNNIEILKKEIDSLKTYVDEKIPSMGCL